nr:unnamed protein product [Spirometra erinaceieuropaei]
MSQPVRSLFTLRPLNTPERQLRSLACSKEADIACERTVERIREKFHFDLRRMSPLKRPTHPAVETAASSETVQPAWDWSVLSSRHQGGVAAAYGQWILRQRKTFQCMWARRDGAVRSFHGRNIRRPSTPISGEFFPILPPDHRPIRMATQDIANSSSSRVPSEPASSSSSPPPTTSDCSSEPPFPSSSSSSSSTTPTPTVVAPATRINITHNPDTSSTINTTTVDIRAEDQHCTCPPCDCTFTSHIGLAGQLQIHRTEADEPVPGAQTYTHRTRLHCPHCPRTFTHLLGLFGHMRIHESGIDRSPDTSTISNPPTALSPTFRVEALTLLQVTAPTSRAGGKADRDIEPELHKVVDFCFHPTSDASQPDCQIV